MSRTDATDRAVGEPLNIVDRAQRLIADALRSNEWMERHFGIVAHADDVAEAAVAALGPLTVEYAVQDATGKRIPFNTAERASEMAATLNSGGYRPAPFSVVSRSCTTWEPVKAGDAGTGEEK